MMVHLPFKLKLFNTVKAVLNIYHWYWVVSGLSMNIDKIKMLKIVEPRDGYGKGKIDWNRHLNSMLWVLSLTIMT